MKSFIEYITEAETQLGLNKAEKRKGTRRRTDMAKRLLMVARRTGNRNSMAAAARRLRAERVKSRRI